MSPTPTEARTFEPEAEEARLTERCQRLVSLARAAGADEAEAYATYGQSLDVKYEKGDLKLSSVSESTSLGLRVFRERRLGFCSVNQTDDAALGRAVADALSLAALNRPEDENRLAEPRAILELESLVHPELRALDIDWLVERAQEFTGRILGADPRVAIDSASLDASRVTHAIATSRGLCAAESDAALSLSSFGMAVDGDDVGGFHVSSDSFRDPALFEARSARAADEFCGVVLGNLGSEKAESYEGPVLFTPEALLSIFVSPLLSAASAIAVQRGRSALAGKVGEKVAASGVHLVDDPTDRELSGACSFDREGAPTGRFELVSGGVLQSLLYNGYAANVEGRASTGHARGGARSVPGLGCHALVVGAGTGGDRAAMEAVLGRGLLVQRFSGTVDPASGDFSGVAKSARWLEPGRAPRPVRETLISGNAFELLAGEVILGSEVELLSGRTRAPRAILGPISVTAG